MLLSGYRKERENYIRILELSQRQRRMLIEGRIDEVISILNDKKRILWEIDRIEKSIEKEKESYRSGCGKFGDTDELIREISELVDRILAVERENEIIFSTGCRVNGGRDDSVTVPAGMVAASYSGKACGGKI